jgi:trans-feruloyl-CoA hydratase/vanillin synthase
VPDTPAARSRHDLTVGGETVRVELDDEHRIAWVSFARPAKRNAINPALNIEMLAVLDALEGDDRCRVVVLTGDGEAWSAGMDLKEYFRDVDGEPPWVQNRTRRQSSEWQWRRLLTYVKPTIAMVNGWCFGGAFVPLVCCDLAIAAEDAVFGLSEVNWGIPPGNLVSRALSETISMRDAMYYVMTGETFDGRRAAEMRLVNEAVPAQRLRERTIEIAGKLSVLGTEVVHGAKVGVRHARLMSWEVAEDYLYAKVDQTILVDPAKSRAAGMAGFLDRKSFRPGLGPPAADADE